MSTTAETGGQVWVNGYTKSDGTVVEGYYRTTTPASEPAPDPVNRGLDALRRIREAKTAGAAEPPATSAAAAADEQAQSREPAGQPELTEAALRSNTYNANNLRDVDARIGGTYAVGMILQARSGAKYTVDHISPQGLVTMSSGHQFRAGDLTSRDAPGWDSLTPADHAHNAQLNRGRPAGGSQRALTGIQLDGNAHPDDLIAVHAANGPETWSVKKIGERRWAVVDAAGTPLDHFTTQRDADGALESGEHPAARLWNDQTAWYGGRGGDPRWKPIDKWRAETLASWERWGGGKRITS